MATYRETLNAYLKREENSEATLAEKAGCTQASINRYRNGKRFPDIEQARKIAAATDGEVSLELWQSDFLRRSGLTPTGEAEAA
ncbi:helix-turn-helix domain-containing protein [Croceibacterium aestuarii]|uniref:helix-turn-helix domain-containing protein n=1 Tax=Croceibacterium aestuarii TaxID=3064139 RepID=UPI00272ED2AC|nr:helix-turn-helix transcriptional regulator [Croceibacterium sp. D39]